MSRLARRIEESRAGGPRGRRRGRAFARAKASGDPDRGTDAHFSDRVLQPETLATASRRRRARPAWLRPAVAAAVVVLTAMLTSAWAMHLTQAVFVPALIAIILVTTFAGAVAGLVATPILGISTVLFVLPPTGRFVPGPTGWTATILYVVCALGIIGVTAWLRGKDRRLESRTRALERASHSLREQARESREIAERIRALRDREEGARAAAEARIARMHAIHGLLDELCRGGRSYADVAAAALEHAPALLACDACAVLATDGEYDRLRVVASRGLSTAVVDSIESLDVRAQAPQGDALREGTGVWLSDGEALSNRYPETVARTWQAARAVALAALPLRTGERLSGVLVLAYRAPQTFTEADRRVAEMFADQLGHAWRHAAARPAAFVARKGRRTRKSASVTPSESGTPLPSLPAGPSN